jgi:voltage-gated potassium channel
MTELTQAWYPGARMARVKESHSYGLVLLMILTSFVFLSVAPQSDWADSVLIVLQAGTLVMAFWTSGLAGVVSGTSLASVALAVVAAIVFAVAGGGTLRGVVGILSGVIIVATIATVAIGVVDQGEANLQSVIGAICIYLLAGFLFFFVYGVIAALDSQPLFNGGTDGTRPIRLYFSFVTLATLGYGDFTPGTNLGRMIAVFEALLGQLYLVTVIAVLVSRIRGRRAAEKSVDV